MGRTRQHMRGLPQLTEGRPSLGVKGENGETKREKGEVVVNQTPNRDAVAKCVDEKAHQRTQERGAANSRTRVDLQGTLFRDVAIVVRTGGEGEGASTRL